MTSSIGSWGGPALLGTVRIPAAAGRHSKVPARWNVVARRASPKGGTGPAGRRRQPGERPPEPRCQKAPVTSSLGPWPSGDQGQLPGPRDGLGTVVGAELAQDVGHVLFDRVERHDQVVGDALV